MANVLLIAWQDADARKDTLDIFAMNANQDFMDFQTAKPVNVLQGMVLLITTVANLMDNVDVKLLSQGDNVNFAVMDIFASHYAKIVFVTSGKLFHHFVKQELVYVLASPITVDQNVTNVHQDFMIIQVAMLVNVQQLVLCHMCVILLVDNVHVDQIMKVSAVKDVNLVFMAIHSVLRVIVIV